MVRKHDPFTQALESLRARAEQGAFTPGAPVVIIEEARRLKLSQTPVREALGWLCGYGLIERAPLGGFVAPRLDAAVVRDRFAFRLLCLTTSLDERNHPLGLVKRAECLASCKSLSDHMLRPIRASADAALLDAYERVNSALSQLTALERRVFEDYDIEASELIGRFRGSSREDLIEGLIAYHRRRMDAASLLVLEAEAGRDVLGAEP